MVEKLMTAIVLSSHPREKVCRSCFYCYAESSEKHLAIYINRPAQNASVSILHIDQLRRIAFSGTKVANIPQKQVRSYEEKSNDGQKQI